MPGGREGGKFGIQSFQRVGIGTHGVDALIPLLRKVFAFALAKQLGSPHILACCVLYFCARTEEGVAKEGGQIGMAFGVQVGL